MRKRKARPEETVQIVIDEPQNPKFVSIKEAAKMNDLTVQAIYAAVWKDKLKSFMQRGKIKIHVDDLAVWRKNVHSREKSTYKGQLLYDNSQGYYSTVQAAAIMGVPSQKVYYATRMGWLKAKRKGSSWVIHSDDIKKYYNDIVLRQAPKFMLPPAPKRKPWANVKKKLC
jgi:hypothetical protein